MGDRSDEGTTRLFGRGSGAERSSSTDGGVQGSEAPGADDAVDERDRLRESGADSSSAPRSWLSTIGARGRSLASSQSASESRGSSMLRSSRTVRSRLSITSYFSLRAVVAIIIAIGVGAFVGETVLPAVGRLVGIVAATILVGLLPSKRRYLEVTTAGASIGAISAVANHAIAPIVGEQSAIGVTAGFVACLLGYYAGRTLRDALARVIGSSESVATGS